MKKLALITILVLSISAMACGKPDKKTAPEESKTVESLVSKTKPNTTTSQSIDLDLSVNNTIVISGIQNILESPDDFLNKTVKLSGYSASFLDDYGNKCYACAVNDPTGCCTYGLEYVLEDKEYPNDDNDITVIGTWLEQNIEGQIFYVLGNAKLI